MQTPKQDVLVYDFIIQNIDMTDGTFMEMEIDLDTHIKISSKIRFLIVNVNNPTLTVKIDDL